MFKVESLIPLEENCTNTNRPQFILNSLREVERDILGHQHSRHLLSLLLYQTTMSSTDLAFKKSVCGYQTLKIKVQFLVPIFLSGDKNCSDRLQGKTLRSFWSFSWKTSKEPFIQINLRFHVINKNSVSSWQLHHY